MERKFNVCFHINDISKCGGTENITTQIASMLCNYSNKYNVYILSMYYDTQSKPFFVGNSKIKYKSLYSKKIGKLKFKYFSTIVKLHNFIKRNNIDILIGVDTIISLFDIPAVYKTNCRFIAWEHFNFYENLGTKIRDYGRKLAAKKADAIVVLTKKDCKNFKNNLNIKTKLVQIYNPYFPKNIKVQKKKNDIPILLSVGRLTYQKGFDYLIEVAKILNENKVVFKWFILGEGEDRKKLEGKIKNYDLEDKVVLLGKVKDVDKFYRISDLFVMTSRFEGLSLVLLEAKAYHLPIISFDCNCGPSEVIVDGEDGYLIEPFNVEKMAFKLKDILTDNNLLNYLKNNANNLIRLEKFLPSVICRLWMNLIDSLVGDLK